VDGADEYLFGHHVILHTVPKIISREGSHGCRNQKNDRRDNERKEKFFSHDFILREDFWQASHHAYAIDYQCHAC
jgi:hypothetical protein